MDAKNVNVYQGCQACLFLLDPRNVRYHLGFFRITSQLDSIEYFKQNVTSVPIHIPILVIANFRDQFDAWKISPAELQSLIDDYSQPPSLPESESHDLPQLAELPSELSTFGTMLGELYEGRRRVIKLIETSMLEKFGLHVGDDEMIGMMSSRCICSSAFHSSFSS